jgi:outer membrane protein OmpA-like peptidoglycan-associated protein
MGRRSIGLASVAATVLLAACAQHRHVPSAKPRTRPPVAQVCTDFSFPIYFETGSDRLADVARQVIADAAGRVRGCVFGRIDVVGLADADGAANRNLALSRRRAESVARALAAEGLPRPEFDVDAVGQLGAVTDAGQSEPLRRRAEVVIRAAPQPIPPPKPGN